MVEVAGCRLDGLAVRGLAGRQKRRLHGMELVVQWVHASPEFTAAMTRVCMDVDQCDEGIGHLVAMTVPPVPGTEGCPMRR